MGGALFDKRLVLVTQIIRGLSRGGDLFPSDWFLIAQFWTPSQSLDWQGAARPTGDAFVATSGSLGICFSPFIRQSKTNRLGVSRMIQPAPVPSNHRYEGEGGAFQSNDWRGVTFHADFLYPAIISRAAAMPLLQAHWKL
jgi:hypothetical protein